MLAQIKDALTRHAQVIATVTGIDVEIVDVGFIRIAGTGHYAHGVGKSIIDEGEIYRHVLRTRQTTLLDNPREHPLCRRCRKREQCRETLSLCTPIVDGEDVVGVIGLVCFTQAERERVLQNRDTYLDFVAQMAEAIGQKLSEHRRMTKASEFLDLMLQIVDADNRGVIVFNAKGGASYANALARRELGLAVDAPLTGIEVRRTRDGLSDLDAFELTLEGRKLSLVGHMAALGGRDPHFARVLAFESLPKVTQRMSSLAGTGKTFGLDAIMGRSPRIRRLKEQIAQVAQSTSTVLITGESGTGKELVARAIHQLSPRQAKPFIAINCGAIPDTLLESELFGYTGGAFTGASSKGRMGKFELANTGVLFLDEIGALPLYFQVKMLRVLQERTFTRLGSNRLLELDIRVIAATNEDLPTLISQGRFREDLFYRLNVVPLETPPLRDRPEDIEVLARHFLAKYAALFNKPEPEPDAGFLASLRAYSWPGNVREFENAMEFLVNMLTPGATPHEGLLPPKPREALASGSGTGLDRADGARGVEADGLQDAAGGPGHLPLMPLAELERRAIETGLARFGNGLKGKRATAEALGISLATLYRKVKEFGLEG
ncbi:MAG: sigma 54-interacting transcriptional regulator [Acidobacteriota bacterium]